MKTEVIIAVIVYKKAMLRLHVSDLKQKVIAHMSPQERGEVQYVLRECLKTKLEEIDQRKTRKERKCSLCNGTGKPCDSCGEYHPKISMCPPHEVRLNLRVEACPDCGRKIRK